ncbi:MAG TPA: hypothetical protein VNZ03_16375 [Terriglobales bacterium]|nr:hypothetical protein [Terriglobales bacterium]
MKSKAFWLVSLCVLFTLRLFAPNMQAQSAATAINGVYNGNYACAQGPRTLKLSLLASGNGSLTGVFTFYMPPNSHSQAFSYSLSGTFDASSGRFRLNPVSWETQPPAGYAMIGMEGAFDPRGGQVAGKITAPACGNFQAKRDQARPANVASVIAPQTSAAGTQATRQTSAQPATPPGQPSATSMTGVYIGTYTCNGGASKLKISLIGEPDDTLAGFFTIDLPSDGPRFTYKLTGRYAWGTHQFLLTGVPWGPEPPAAHSMTQLTGKYYPGSDMLHGNVTSMFCSDFWGERDKSESPESIAAAMRTPPVPSSSRPQPAEPSAAAIKAALPPPAPPNGLVRKSRAYWENYRYDLTRQVFDGGFGSDIDSDRDFRFLFHAYVDMYSKHCRAYLPAQHVTLEITQQGQTAMVVVDSRFAPSYREPMLSAGETLAGAVAISSGSVSASDYLSSSAEIEKFFAKETCKSAAMHQLNENLLRAATKERSLQQAGATIPGAAAETDKSLPPGRFARFVDGCNAFFREPANSRHRPANAWCKCLSEHYQTLMSRDEESLYGNDFERLFFRGIAQPNSTDPGWQRFHPACGQCAR